MWTILVVLYKKIYLTVSVSMGQSRLRYECCTWIELNERMSEVGETRTVFILIKHYVTGYSAKILGQILRVQRNEGIRLFRFKLHLPYILFHSILKYILIWADKTHGYQSIIFSSLKTTASFWHTGSRGIRLKNFLRKCLYN